MILSIIIIIIIDFASLFSLIKGSGKKSNKKTKEEERKRSSVGFSSVWLQVRLTLQGKIKLHIQMLLILPF